MTLTAPASTAAPRLRPLRADRLARWAIFAYVHLWIIEGALRKWVPGMEQVGYLARDLIVGATLIVIALIPRRTTRGTAWFWAFGLGLLTLGTVQVLANRISFLVMIAGLRSYLAPLLVVALVWQFSHAVTFHDVAKRILVYLPVEALLVVLQVSSPASAPINREVVSDAATFVNNFGVVRPSGTFSAPSGMNGYLAIVTAIALAWLLDSTRTRRRLALPAVAVAALCVALSGSRTALVMSTSTIAVFALLLLLQPSPKGGKSRATLTVQAILAWGSVGTAIALSFSNVLDSFMLRIENAAMAEDSAQRLMNAAFAFASFQPLDAPGNDLGYPILGNGMGGHSQAGIALGSGFPWIEIETVKWVYELGALGYLLGWLRMLIVAIIVFHLITRFRRLRPPYPLIASVLIPTLVVGQITQAPSMQAAFGVMVALLILSSGPSGEGEPDSEHLEAEVGTTKAPVRASPVEVSVPPASFGTTRGVETP